MVAQDVGKEEVGDGFFVRRAADWAVVRCVARQTCLAEGVLARVRHMRIDHQGIAYGTISGIMALSALVRVFL